MPPLARSADGSCAVHPRRRSQHPGPQRLSSRRRGRSTPMWQGSADAPPTARIAMLAPSMQPSERRVAEAIAADADAAIEWTAQEIADTVGVGRATVIRTAQTLGYDGYPQLRVALARERATAAPVQEDSADPTMLGALRGAVDRFAARLAHTVSAVTEETLSAFVNELDVSTRL